jgi:phage-related protein
MWIVELTLEAAAEFDALPEDQQARFHFVRNLIEAHGLTRVGMPHVRHIEGPLWEIRLKGRDGISRALYVAARYERVVVVRVFTKKTEKTPRREIKLALERAKGVS